MNSTLTEGAAYYVRYGKVVRHNFICGTEPCAVIKVNQGTMKSKTTEGNSMGHLKQKLLRRIDVLGAVHTCVQCRRKSRLKVIEHDDFDRDGTQKHMHHEMDADR